MKSQLLLIFTLMCNLFFSQSSEKLKEFVLDKYPDDQVFYKGGLKAFYSDVHNVIVQNKIKACGQDEPNQYYKLKLKIYPDGRTEKLKNVDSLINAKNECARVLANNVVKDLKNWNPGVYHGIQVPAIAEIYIFPYDLFGNYKEGLNSVENFKLPEFPGGKQAMINTIHREFYTIFRDFDIQGSILLNFDISEKGEMNNLTVWPKIMEQNFVWETMRTFKRIKTTWKPAMRNGVPMAYHFEYGMGMSVGYNYDRTNKDNNQ
ncbi:energy transducer TonB [Elizabethkingia anophelis]|uniref:energy transducer TonB n=1 Tax=Elizabethkingia anophelis TaxID=1117645 RepID=UPI00136E531A|nr:energy transducer TonB [Elizabethkingia anophelis]MYY27060.1 hypothetical protein [Elizabethkingia anophelis]